MTAEFIVAVHAMVFLNHRKESLSSDIIAENVCTNPARVRKVLLKLKKAGLVETKEGVEGGYAFHGDPKSITLKDIFEAVCVSVVKIKWRSGNPEMECPVASGMAPIMDGVFASMNENCKQTLATITIDDVDKRIFPEGETEHEL